jgi:hypothetical protein
MKNLEGNVLGLANPQMQRSFCASYADECVGEKQAPFSRLICLHFTLK